MAKANVTKTNRRKFLTRGPVAAVAAAAAVPVVASAQAPAAKPVKKVHWTGGKRPEKPPLFSGIVSFGDLVFIAGIGAHFDGDITAHTKHVLDEMAEARSSCVGSSMEKVLKVNVYLNDLKDYAAMNEAFRGRFGPEPGAHDDCRRGRHPRQLAGRDRLHRDAVRRWGRTETGSGRVFSSCHA